MKKIAFDVMGNDNGPLAAITAVNIFMKNNADYFFYLVGDAKFINQHLIKHHHIKVINAQKIVSGNISIKKTIADQETSMAIAINLVQQQKADIVISSGDSGTYLAMTTLLLKRLTGIKRPAFMPILPTLNVHKKLLMLDVGANLVATGEMLVQWAEIGHNFSKNFLGIKKPKIAIINVGHEQYKGQNFHLQAYKTLEKNKMINFQGFIEPKKIFDGKIDVVVTDGYAGNMILKTIEGTVESLFFVIKKIFKANFIYKILSLVFKSFFKKIKHQIDYRNVGAAWVVGLQNFVIKCHGNADTKSYLATFNQIKMAFKNGIEQISNEK